MTENTAKYAGGKMVGERYYDIINNKPKPQQEEKSGEEIVLDIVKLGGLELV